MAKKKVKSKAKQPPKSSIPDNISSEVIAEAYSSGVQQVFMKVCRLCESKDGPFLNIFDADKVTAKKIDELMPFGIAENDDLPHKICFRCSAKLEELYEFIHKCIKTQESLRTAIGKTGPFLTKTKTRKAWEEKLNKTNMSNDDICDALIKKAMEGIKDIPLKPLPIGEDELPTPSKRVTRRTDLMAPKKEPPSDDNGPSEVNVKQSKLSVEKNDAKPLPEKTNKTNNVEATQSQSSNNKKTENDKKQSESKENNITLTSSLSFDYVEEKKSNNIVDDKKSEKPFNIMDHVSMIKVTGVGVLFQCKLCNRNFLIKEVVESHTCAKNGIPKVEIPKTVPVPEAPKVSTVKYIKIDGDMNKPNSWKSYRFENDPNTNSKNRNDVQSTDKNKNDGNSSGTEKNNKHEDSLLAAALQNAPIVKPKPRIGPASKTRRVETATDSGLSQKDSQESQQSNSQAPSVHIPSIPNLNGRYKLVPGPNNIFTLVEDSAQATNQVPIKEIQKTAKKRRSELDALTSNNSRSKDGKKDLYEQSKSPGVVDLEEKSKPYPVGLFQTVGHSSRLYEPPIAPPTPFTTPAMKKQSYTIVQTGNPSKLLISTKALAPPVEVPKKRLKKSKPELRNELESKEPFRVTLEDVAHPKDSGFFTFINVDPLLQPSYVLPTDNIIQESQISTSTAIVQNATEGNKESKDKDKYACNMCGESFSREKKLLAHIQSHYTKMDEEDQLRAEKGSKRKGKKQ